MDKRNPLDLRPVATGDVVALFRAWSSFGSETVTRMFDATQSAASRMAEATASHWANGVNARGLAEDMLAEGALLATNVAAAPMSALAVAVAQIDAGGDDLPAEVEDALSCGAPAPIARSVSLDPQDANRQRLDLAERAGALAESARHTIPETRVADRFVLPARVLDASQAWASWHVSTSLAWGLIEEAVALGHQPVEALAFYEPVSVGTGQSMVSIVATDYRASDFGVLREIGLTLSVTPRGGAFPDPGQMFLRLIVTDPYSLVAARRIWGIRKDLCDAEGAGPRSALDVAYSENRVCFGLGAARSGVLRPSDRFEIDFPRFGRGASHRVPGLICSMIEPEGRSAGPVAPARSVLTRSGTGEGLQFGGDVRLTLGQKNKGAATNGCFCAGGMACLCETMRRLDLPERRPAANGWTERMSGTLGEPALINAPGRPI